MKYGLDLVIVIFQKISCTKVQPNQDFVSTRPHLLTTPPGLFGGGGLVLAGRGGGSPVGRGGGGGVVVVARVNVSQTGQGGSGGQPPVGNVGQGATGQSQVGVGSGASGQGQVREPPVGQADTTVGQFGGQGVQVGVARGSVGVGSGASGQGWAGPDLGQLGGQGVQVGLARGSVGVGRGASGHGQVGPAVGQVSGQGVQVGVARGSVGGGVQRNSVPVRPVWRAARLGLVVGTPPPPGSSPRVPFLECKYQLVILQYLIKINHLILQTGYFIASHHTNLAPIHKQQTRIVVCQWDQVKAQGEESVQASRSCSPLHGS